MLLRKRDSYRQRVAKLEQQLADCQSKIVQQALDHGRLRVHYQGIVAQHIAINRRNEDKILADAFRIQELDNQVAVQWRNLAEAKDDASTAKLNCDVYRKETKQLQEERKQWRQLEAILRSQVDEIDERLYEATKTLQYRLYQAIVIGIARKWRRFTDYFSQIP